MEAFIAPSICCVGVVLAVLNQENVAILEGLLNNLLAFAFELCRITNLVDNHKVGGRVRIVMSFDLIRLVNALESAFD